MTAAWLARIAQLGPFDAIVVGSDPAFSPTLGRGLRRLQPRAALVHWCFDLYPEAIAAEMGDGDGDGCRVTCSCPSPRGLMKWGYGAYDALVDIGPRMQERLAAYGAGAPQQTLVPWALVEPTGAPVADPRVRAELYPAREAGAALFGNDGARPRLPRVPRAGARLPGPLGRRRRVLLLVARQPSGRAPRRRDPRRHQRHPGPVRRRRRRCRRGWAPPTFTSSACSRSGPASWSPPSSSARWPSDGRCSTRGRATPRSRAGSRQHDVGLTLGGGDCRGGRRPACTRSSQQPDDLARWQGNAFAVYQREFSKKVVNDRWDETLRALCARRGGG